MRVLELHGRTAEFGGASVHTEILVNYMLSQSVDGVHIITPKKSEYLIECFYTSKNVNYQLMETESITNVITNLINLITFINKNKIDVIHSHHRNADILACLVKMFSPSVTVVSTLHGPAEVQISWKYRLISKLHVLLLKNLAAKVICISKFVQDTYVQAGVTLSKCSVIYNGSSKPSLNNITNIEKKCKTDKFVVTMLCNISGYKRVDLLLEIAQKLYNENIEFWIVGDGKDKLSLEAEAKKLGLKIRFWGWTRDIGAFIKLSDMIISTAYDEGFGRTLTEAMSFGKPIVAFHSGGPKEIIIDGKNGRLITLGNTDEYANAIYEIYSDPMLYSKMSLAAYNSWESEFSDKVFGRNYLNCFKNVIKKR